MDRRKLFKSKLTVKDSQADRRQHFKNKRAMERDNLRNFGRDITITLENSNLHQPNEEGGRQFRDAFKRKYREDALSKQNKEAALIHWRPPFMSVVPVGKFVSPPTTTALSKRIIKTQEIIQKTLTAKKVFPPKTPETTGRPKRNKKKLNLNTGYKVMKENKRKSRANVSIMYFHSTTEKNKNKRKQVKVITNNNFEVSEEDDLAGISPIEDVDTEDDPSPTVVIETIDSNDPDEKISVLAPSPARSHREKTFIQSPQNCVTSFVTTSRGKHEYETIHPILNSEEDEQMIKNHEAALIYEGYLSNEIHRLKELSLKWEIYKSENLDLVDCIELIDGTVGQTKLLISSKFEQFRKLIENCRFKNGDQPIFPLDLEGFWDMVKLQIKNVDDRFLKLETLKLNDWKEEVPPAKLGTKKKVGKKAKSKRKSVTSNLRALIERKRQQKLDEENAALNEATSSRRETRQSFRASTSNLVNISQTEGIHQNLGNLKINSPLAKTSKKRGKSIRFVEPATSSSDSDVIFVENENKESETVGVANGEMLTVTPKNTKRESRKYRDTPKIPILNLTDTPDRSTERRRSIRTPKSKLSFCDELNNCSIRDSSIRPIKRTPKRTRRIIALINNEIRD